VKRLSKLLLDNISLIEGETIKFFIPVITGIGIGLARLKQLNRKDREDR
jgi:hypothetical protein